MGGWPGRYDEANGLFFEDGLSDAASDAAGIIPKAVNAHAMQRGGGGVGGLPLSAHGVAGSRGVGAPSGPPAAAVRWGFGVSVPATGTPPPVPSGSLGRLSGSPSPQPGRTRGRTALKV